MHVTYGFVYYFTLVFLFLTASLLIFVVRSIRRPVFNFLKKHKVMEHFSIQIALAISFIVIIVILIDSIFTYNALRRNLETGKVIKYFRKY